MEDAHPDHAYSIASRLRPIDTFEIQATHPEVPVADALAWGIAHSADSFLISSVQDNVLHGLWGYGPWDQGPKTGGVGFVWLVSDESLFKDYPKTLTAIARRAIFPALDEVFPGGYGNFVYSQNDVHLRWLSANGFSAYGTFPVNGHDFVLMMRKPNV